MSRWLREVIASHYYGDPLTVILSDLVVVLAVLFGVLLIRYQLAHGGRWP